MISKVLNYFIAGGVLLCLVFTALAHGTVETWSIAFFQLLTLFLVFLWVVRMLLEKEVSLRIPITFWPLSAFFLYGLIQTISFSGSDGNIVGLSYDVEATRWTVFILLTLIALHVLAFNHFATDNRLEFLVRFLTFFGVALSMLSLIQYLTGNSIFFWSETGRPPNQWSTGPFVNHNHFAGYLELIIPIPVGLVMTGGVTQTRVLYGFAAAIMMVATVFSASRAGIVSISAALLFIFIIGFSVERSKQKSKDRDLGGTNRLPRLRMPFFRGVGAAALIVLATISGLVWLGLNPVLTRLPDTELVGIGANAETFESSRGWIWSNSYEVFRNNPVFGTGLGTFETVFPIYSEGFPAASDGKLQIWDRAHNDYLQILTDTGLIGGAICVWFIATLLICMRRTLRLNDRFHSGAAIGAIGAILSISIHSVFDFNLQLPSTALLFSVVVGILVNPSDRGRVENS